MSLLQRVLDGDEVLHVFHRVRFGWQCVQCETIVQTFAATRRAGCTPRRAS